MQVPHLVLASASEARRRLMSAAGLPHTCDSPDVDEAAVKRAMAGAESAEVALALAERKALAVARNHPGSLVIGADQMLDCEGHRFDKPGSRAAAREQLRRLRGRSHRLLSAVVIARGAAVLWRHVETASLTMRGVDDAFIEDYLDRAGDGIFFCVGAYRLEGCGVHLFERIDGDYFTILGLPLLPLLGALRSFGAAPR